MMHLDSDDQNEKSHEWSEFTDRLIVDWKRVRSAIEHENLLVNHRLTWLFASQAFLFAAFTFVFIEWVDNEKNSPEAFVSILGIIEFAGFGISLVIWRGLFSAQKQLTRLDRWWHSSTREDLSELDKPYVYNDPQRIGAMKRLLPKHPPIEGAASGKIDSLLSQSSVPVVFMFAWTALALTGLDLVVPVVKSVQEFAALVWPYITVITMSLVISEVLRYVYRGSGFADMLNKITGKNTAKQNDTD